MTFPVAGSPAWYAAAPPPDYGGPAQPPAATAPGAPVGGGFDWRNDPGYLAALNQEQLGLGQLDAALKTAREKAIIDFGDPSIAGLAGFGLDPGAAAMAQQNVQGGNAVVARYQKQHDLARRAIINKLASQGILGSGDLGYLSGQEDQSYGNQVYDARQKLLDYLSGLTQNYLGQKQSLHQSVLQALQNAYQSYLASQAAYSGAFNAYSGAQ